MQFEQAEMPAQMTVQPAIVIVERQPVAQERDAALPFSGLVRQMSEGVCRIGVAPDLSQRTFDHRTRRIMLADFRQRHTVMTLEPPVVTVVEGEPTQKVD